MTDTTRPPRCSTCNHLAANGTCRLRSLVIPAPDRTACVSHPDHGPLRVPFAIGPAVTDAGTGESILQPSLDDRDIRKRLLDLVADIQVIGTRPLTPREEIVVWQLREFGEPRAIVHLDRIEATQTINRARAGRGSSLPGLLGVSVGLLRTALPATGPAATTDAAGFLLRFTLAGRLLLLSSLIVGSAAFAGLMYFEAAIWQRLGSQNVTLHLGLAVGGGITVAGLWILGGRKLLDRCGVALRADHATPHGPEGDDRRDP